MGNSLRCCLACILPCGALDVVRVVHLNGHVDEYGGQVFATQVMSAHPGHVISKPGCHDCDSHLRRRLVILSPESELKKGHIYFLVPISSVPDIKEKSKGGGDLLKTTKRKKNESGRSAASDQQDGYLKETLLETKPGRRHRRPIRRSGVWRPLLQSISEDP